MHQLGRWGGGVARTLLTEHSGRIISREIRVVVSLRPLSLDFLWIGIIPSLSSSRVYKCSYIQYIQNNNNNFFILKGYKKISIFFLNILWYIFLLSLYSPADNPRVPIRLNSLYVCTCVSLYTSERWILRKFWYATLDAERTSLTFHPVECTAVYIQYTYIRTYIYVYSIEKAATALAATRY